MSDEEKPTDSLTSRQIAILRGRGLPELSARERLAFANAASRPVPLYRYPAAEEFRFRIDVQKAASVDPARRLRIANGASEMERIRKQLTELRRRLDGVESETTAGAIHQQLDRLSKEGAALFAEIGEFEIKV
jgi:hypothetical protein